MQFISFFVCPYHVCHLLLQLEFLSLTGKVEGKRDRGKQRITFLDSLCNSATGGQSKGLNFFKLYDDRGVWRGMAAKVCSRSGTWWWWWCHAVIKCSLVKAIIGVSNSLQARPASYYNDTNLGILEQADWHTVGDQSRPVLSHRVAYKSGQLSTRQKSMKSTSYSNYNHKRKENLLSSYNDYWLNCQDRKMAKDEEIKL